MINVTILAMVDQQPKIMTSVDKLMNERLTGLATDLQAYLTKVFLAEKSYEDLVVYISYNTKYSVQWKIVSDVSTHIQAEVAKCCTNLGYLEWKDTEQSGI